jgi:hypothetical protein
MNIEDYDYWNYRVMIGFDEKLSIREVFYDRNDLILSWTMMPTHFLNDDVEDLWYDYTDVGEAFNLPILLERDLENQFLEAGKAALPLEKSQDDEDML